MEKNKISPLHGNLDEVMVSFFNMANIARREGLLALEEVMYQVESAPLMVKIGVTLVVDGSDPEIIMEILTNLMESGDIETDDEYKEALIIRTGIQAIQMGENPRILMAKMASHLGFEAYLKYVEGERFDFDKENIMIFGEKYVEPKRTRLSTDEINSLLADPEPEKAEVYVSDLVVSALLELFLNFENRDYVLGRCCDMEIFAGALHVVPEETLKEIMAGEQITEELINAYHNDDNTLEVNSKRANYLFDLMMGGDGSCFL